MKRRYKTLFWRIPCWDFAFINKGREVFPLLQAGDVTTVEPDKVHLTYIYGLYLQNTYLIVDKSVCIVHLSLL